MNRAGYWPILGMTVGFVLGNTWDHWHSGPSSPEANGILTAFWLGATIVGFLIEIARHSKEW